ncbi:MAG: hypothetical protein LM590_11835 [Thermofilum sp.]|jgi:hypothetical protein|nr:hypothetical protein [Thermofilum sp.]
MAVPLPPAAVITKVLLVKEVVKMGIKRIIITHPIYQLINMPVEIQKELSKKELLLSIVTLCT